VVTGASDGVRFADNGEILFGWLHVPEERLRDVEQASCQVHRGLHRLMRERGFPHWLRAWNYLSHINEGEGDAERYRRFTAGRHRALADAFAGTPQFDTLLPAATGIGMRGESGLTVCFFAGRTPGIQVENPRQVSAFRYPRHYGPRSPSFSRATLYHWAGRSTLFVSGTASIVGHATLHPGDAVAQFEETLCNLDALVGHAAQEHSLAGAAAFAPGSFKLYVRDPQHLQALGPLWRAALAERAPTAVLIGDLCRSDLLVEVEAVYERHSP
jgi:chorismate lyase/3-hydroxybenzoate synthase